MHSPPQRPGTASSTSVPPFGQIRCYWALLVPSYGSKLDLKFVYFDPTLSSHLGHQQIPLLSRGIMELIHPAEREQARADLASAISNDDLQGSVTRMRFARLSRIRAIMGCPPQENLRITPDIVSVVEDDDYVILDLVLNWVADGLLLAFFHCIKDKDPVKNNDPNYQHEGWSNFCGAASFPEEAIQSLQQSISTSVTPPTRTRAPPTRVFQIHSTVTPPNQNSCLFSWPPPRPPNSPVQVDGLYDANEYSDFMRGVDMDPNQLAAKPGEVRTNCSTRFGAEHSIRTENVYRHVTSVFIPYGSVIFACFQTTKLYDLPPLPSSEAWNQPTSAPPAPPPVATPAPPPPPPPVPPREWRSNDYDQYPPPPRYAHEQSPYSPHHPPYAGHSYDAGGAPVPYHRLGGSENTPTPPRVTSGSSTRPLVRPPGDVEKCRGCGTRESPEWRKGENGIKDLCNACGLKLARAVAKREGRQKSRKKDRL